MKQLVELHGGTVRVKSPGLGQGATFVVALPLTIVYAETTPQDDRRHPVARDTGPSAATACLSLQGVKIVVVDDEPDARDLLKRLLEDYKATVMIASSAVEALILLARERPQVLVSDIGMPIGWLLTDRASSFANGITWRQDASHRADRLCQIGRPDEGNPRGLSDACLQTGGTLGANRHGGSLAARI